MSRSRGWLTKRRRGSSRTARAVPSLVESPTGWTGSRLRPDSDSSLSDGVVVETHLRARLLGVRLLRVDGVVLLSPGRLTGSAYSWPPPGTEGDGTNLVEAARLLDETDASLRNARGVNGRPIG